MRFRVRLAFFVFAVAILAALAWMMRPLTSAPSVLPAAVAEKEPPPPAAFRVARIIDADTIDVTTPAGEAVRIRVLDIDAPERAQPGGSQATAWVQAALSIGEPVDLVGDSSDRYGRRLSHVRHDGGQDLAAGLVASGHAWRWTHGDRPDLDALAKAARDAGRGLWADPAAIDPAAWRKLTAAEREAARDAAEQRRDGITSPSRAVGVK